MKNTLYVALSFLLLFISCKDENPVIEPEPPNLPPIIQSLTADKSTLESGEETRITCVASDPDGDFITYNWICSYGEFVTSKTSSSVWWKAPVVNSESTFTISISVKSANSQTIIDNVRIEVLPSQPTQSDITLIASPLLCQVKIIT